MANFFRARFRVRRPRFSDFLVLDFLDRGTPVVRAASGVKESGVVDHSLCAPLEEFRGFDAPTLGAPEVFKGGKERWIVVERRIRNSCSRDVSCFVVGQSEHSNAKRKRKRKCLQ